MQQDLRKKQKIKYILVLSLGITFFVIGILLPILELLQIWWINAFILVIGFVISLYASYKLQDLSIKVFQPEDRNDPTKLQENITKYFLREEFSSLPGFDITQMKIDGQGRTNQELGLIKGHVFDDLLIMVVKIADQEQKKKLHKLINEDPSFTINQKLISNPQDLQRDNHILSNFVITYTHSHSFNLLKDINRLLKQVEVINV